MNSKIPGQLGFPIWVCCVLSMTHLLHVASVAWCVEGTFPLSIQPSTGSQGARSSCTSVPITWQLKPFHKLPVSLSQLGVAGHRSTVSPNPESQRSYLSLSRYFLPDTPWRTILPGHNIFHILSCPYWPKGYCMNILLFNLLKSIL